MTHYSPPIGQFTRLQHNYCYFDSAATCLVPEVVLQHWLGFYRDSHASVHRSSHAASRAATLLVEQARAQIAQFIGADPSDLCLPPSTTVALNMVAEQLPIDWQAGDEIILSVAEHHANLLPWQRLAERHQLTLKWLEFDVHSGTLVNDWQQLFSARTKLLAITAASNLTGAIMPLAELCAAAREVGALSVIDAAQAAAHVQLDVQQLGCDVLVFSGHKCYGVTGAAGLFLQPQLWPRMQPWLRGGGMVEQVGREQAQWLASIQRFEAGSPDSAAIVTFAAALRWLAEQQAAGLHPYLADLRQQLVQGLQQREWLRVLPSGGAATPLVSFYSPQIHAYDLALWLDAADIAVRAGSHCAQPFLQHFGLESVVRVSLGAYNTAQQIQRLLSELDQAHALLA
jgi:cysteine desulfurase/selenocysteine lyase